MKYYLVMIFLLLSLSPFVFAENFSSTIHSIGFGKASETHLIRFDNSRVVFVDPKDKEFMNAFVTSHAKKEAVKVQVNNDNTVVAAQSVPGSIHHEDIAEEKIWRAEPFEPTVVRDYNTALSIFGGMRKDYKRDGECFNRAHIWAYEENESSGRNLMKIFMFFTERYIRKYKFHWWFHVTPMVYWGSLSKPRTLDRRYSGGPRQTKPWSDTFIKSKRRCEVVDTFDEFWLNQESEDCYHIYTSMYYVVPRDIEKRDLTGLEKAEFSGNEIRRAYQNAFKE